MVDSPWMEKASGYKMSKARYEMCDLRYEILDEDEIAHSPRYIVHRRR